MLSGDIKGVGLCDQVTNPQNPKCIASSFYDTSIYVVKKY